MNPLASTFITSALVFYSIGVWGERLVGRLRWWNLVFFVLGLICDTVGTGMMFDFVGGMTFDVHGISGLIAILLMFVHAVWALVVLLKKDDESPHQFPQVQRGRLGRLADPLLQSDVLRHGAVTPTRR